MTAPLITRAERELLESIAENDLAVLESKRVEYGDSWKQRGGIGAFFAFVRKWDRIEQKARAYKYDVFRACMQNADVMALDESYLDDIGDLRRFLLLVEGEMRSRFSDSNGTALPSLDDNDNPF